MTDRGAGGIIMNMRALSRHKILIIVMVLVLTGIGVMLYNNKLGKYGLCAPGYHYVPPRPGSLSECVKKSGYHGKKCKTSRDCPGSTCVLKDRDPDPEYPGICRDVEPGCYGPIIDDEGNYQVGLFSCS